jgi:hypothetical protein
MHVDYRVSSLIIAPKEVERTMTIGKALVLLGICSAVSYSDVVVSTIPTPQQVSGQYGMCTRCPEDDAVSFTSPGAYTLNQISLDLFTNPTQPPTSVIVEVRQDALGQPGALVGPSFTLTVSNPTYSVAIASVAVYGISVIRGPTYWLEILPNTGPVVAFELNHFNTQHDFETSLGGVFWTDRGMPSFGIPGFELDGTPTAPEPNYTVLLTGGLISVLGLRSKIRRR